MKRTLIPARILLLLPALVLTAGIAVPATQDDATVAEALARELIALCPPAAPDDAKARDACADRLVRSALLRESFAPSISFGTLVAGKSYRPEESNLTRFNPFVWRRIYLSLFTFPGAYQIEKAAPYTVIHLPFAFRNRLDPGEYPYPFWHSKAKWQAYQRAVELLFVIEQGKVIGVYRSPQQDAAKPLVPREWDGAWRWTSAKGEDEPRAALYTALFSPANPHVERLDAAYKAFEAEGRKHQCFTCHSPDNGGKMNPLRLLNYPNQALTERHTLVAQLDANAMPPGGGIEEDDQRLKLLALARDFAAIGDQALDYEREFQPAH